MLLFAGPKILVFSRVPPLRSERGCYPGQKILARRTRACANAKAFPAVRIPSALPIHKNGWRGVVAMVNADGDRDARGRHAMVESPPDPALGHRTARGSPALHRSSHRFAESSPQIGSGESRDRASDRGGPCHHRGRTVRGAASRSSKRRSTCPRVAGCRCLGFGVSYARCATRNRISGRCARAHSSRACLNHVNLTCCPFGM